MIYDKLDYREILRERLAGRQGRNPSYSLRAYARDLGISPSRLSEILSGDHALSAAKAEGVAAHLGLSTDEQAHFVDLVAIESSPSSSVKADAKKRVDARRSSAEASEVSADQFALVSRWWHFAMLELFKTKEFKPTPTWIAGRLGIAKDEARAAMARLLRLGFLRRSGKSISVSKPKTRTPYAVHSEAIRSYHHELVKRADQAIELQGFDERDTSSVVLAVDGTRIAEARERIAKFRREFAEDFAVQKNASSVYCLAVHYFRLDKGQPTEIDD